MIRELQNRSHAKIQVDHSNTHPDPNIKLITVTGSDSSLIKAEELISCIVEKTSVDAMTALNMFSEERSTRGSSLSYGPTSTYTPPIATRHPGISPTLSNPSQQYHPGVPVDVSHRGGHAVHPPIYGYTPPNSMPAPSIPVPAQHGLTIVREIFPCSKVCMGRIIGRKGITVNDVQKRSGCDIQINQDVPPGRDCEITILGSRPGIDIAKRILMDIIQMGSNHPYAGGEGAASGMYDLSDLSYSCSLHFFKPPPSTACFVLLVWCIRTKPGNDTAFTRNISVCTWRCSVHATAIHPILSLPGVCSDAVSTVSRLCRSPTDG